MNERTLEDVNLSKSVALPVAANTVNTNAIDLLATVPFPITADFTIKIGIDTATGANNKNVNAVVQHSNESNANFTNIAGLGAPVLVATGNTTNVIGANVSVILPPGTRRYVRASATGEANGGNASDGNLSIKLLK